jgi:protein SCO1
MIVAAACGGHSSSTTFSPPPPSVGSAMDRPVPARIAHLPLTTDTGEKTNLASFHGRAVVLTDFLTLCQDVCPMTSQNYAQIQAAVARAGLSDHVQLVELTVDPQRDSPARLRAYRRLYDAPANWSLLTASPSTVQEIWQYFGAYYKKARLEQSAGVDWWTRKPLAYDVDHNDVLVFLDPAGSQRFVISALPDTGGRQPPAVLHQFLDRLGRSHLNHPGRTAWTVPQALQALSWVLRKPIS